MPLPADFQLTEVNAALNALRTLAAMNDEATLLATQIKAAMHLTRLADLFGLHAPKTKPRRRTK